MVFKKIEPQKEIPLTIHNKKSRRIKKSPVLIEKDIFLWYLSAFIGMKEEGNKMQMDGQIEPPVKTIGILPNKLTSQYLLNQLNTYTYFDKNIQEGDNLKIYYITKQYANEYVSFIFRNEKWIEGFYNFFYHETKSIAQGKLILEDSDLENEWFTSQNKK